MRVRTFFVASMLAVASMSAIAVGAIVWTQQQRLQMAGEARSAAEAVGSLLRASERSSLERGVFNLALLADAPADGAMLADLEANAAATDAALDQTLQSLDRAAVPWAVEQKRNLEEIKRQVVALRQASYQALRMPRTDRDPAFHPSYIKQMFGFLDAAAKVANKLELAGSTANPAVGNLIGIARLAWDMRDSAGRRINIYVRLVQSAQPATPEFADAIATYSGEIDHAWRRLQAVLDETGRSDNLQQVSTAVDTDFFGKTASLTAPIMKAARGDGVYPLAAKDVRSGLLANYAPLVQIRETAIGEALARADRSADSARTYLIYTVLLLLVIAGGIFAVSAVFNRLVVSPLLALTQVITRLAAGNRNVEIPARERRNEIGHMAQAIETLRLNAVKASEIAAENDTHHERQRARGEILEQFTAEFASVSRAAIDDVLNASRTMQQHAEVTASVSQEVARQSAVVASASSQASTNVQTVASASEELTSSINDIGRRLERSSAIAAKAMQEAQGATARVSKLSSTSGKIGEIVKLIEGIAAQTNLLALNATIEAARAGDAGKGFAVVASEVKALANQTAKATEDIATQVATIQQETGGAVEEILSISKTINDINAIAADVAAAVQEQNTATEEISRNVHEAARGTHGVSDSIAGVATTVGKSGAAAKEMLAAVQLLSDCASGLTKEISVFIDKVRVA